MAELFIDTVKKERACKIMALENQDTFIERLYTEIYEREYLREGLQECFPQASYDDITKEIHKYKEIDSPL